MKRSLPFRKLPLGRLLDCESVQSCLSKISKSTWCLQNLKILLFGEACSKSSSDLKKSKFSKQKSLQMTMLITVCEQSSIFHSGMHGWSVHYLQSTVELWWQRQVGLQNHAKADCRTPQQRLPPSDYMCGLYMSQNMKWVKSPIRASEWARSWQEILTPSSSARYRSVYASSRLSDSRRVVKLFAIDSNLLF